MNYYATLGETCKDAPTIAAVIRAGVGCFRLNLSHGSLREKADWLDALHRAERETAQKVGLLIDLRGPEVRTGKKIPAAPLQAGETVSLSALMLPKNVAECLMPGQELRLDDSGAVLRLEENDLCRVMRAGQLAPRKSVALPGLALRLPPLTEDDLAYLSDAASCGVTAVMQPFVHSREELTAVRRAMAQYGLGHALLYAKVEDEAGLNALPEWIEACDVVTAARGDLGANLGLERVPAAQKRIAALCRQAGKPLLVVTELLASMTAHPTPTRAEVSDICTAVWDGAEHLMLTNETAAGSRPAASAEWLKKCAEAAKGVDLHTIY